MPESISLARGRCLCGAVTFEVSLPTKFVAHCHCTMCRRAHGAPYVTWVGVPSQQFRLLSGEQRLVRYASSPAATRRFCSVCGSSLFFESSRWAGETHVALAAFEDGLDWQPQCHVFVDDRAAWSKIGDDLPRLGGPTGTEPLASAQSDPPS